MFQALSIDGPEWIEISYFTDNFIKRYIESVL